MVAPVPGEYEKPVLTFHPRSCLAPCLWAFPASRNVLASLPALPLIVFDVPHSHSPELCLLEVDFSCGALSLCILFQEQVVSTTASGLGPGPLRIKGGKRAMRLEVI